MSGPAIRGVVLGLLSVSAMAPAGASAAPAVDGAARCASMKDPIGCGCALATGGTLSATTWARGSDRAAFEACVAGRGGSAAPARPGTIPARL